MNDSLLERTYRLLDEADATLPRIAEGAGVNYHWLAKFKQRKHPNPGVLHVERLHRWLTSERAPGDESAAA